VGLGRNGGVNHNALIELKVKAIDLDLPFHGRHPELYADILRPGKFISRSNIMKTHRTQPKDAVRFGWDRNYVEKRKCVDGQNTVLARHAAKQGIPLFELSLACNPERHLSSCPSKKLISYEIVRNIYRKQLRGVPYKGFCCKRHVFLLGNVMAAVLERKHPEITFFNNDTMGTLGGIVGEKLYNYGVVVSSFLGDGMFPKYYRPVLLTGGAHKCARGFWSTKKTQRQHDILMQALRFRPIEKWKTYDSEFSALQVATRTYLYTPDVKISTWLAASRFILSNVTETKRKRRGVKMGQWRIIVERRLTC